MFPTLIDLGRLDLPLLGEVHLRLPTYGFMFALGALIAWWWFLRRARTLGLREEDVFNLAFYSLLGGIVGAKLTLVALDWRFYLADPRELVGTLRSAGVLAGGILVGAVAFIVYCRRRRLPLFELGDAVAAPLALAQAVGRLGCLMAGCCWGVPADAHNRCAVTFDDPVAHAQTGVPLGVPLVPVQAIQMIHDLALAALLTWLWHRRPRQAGTVFWIYLLLYGIGRGTIEFWRGDAQRGLYFGGSLSTSQLFALAGIAVALFMLARGLKRPREAEGAHA